MDLWREFLLWGTLSLMEGLGILLIRPPRAMREQGKCFELWNAQAQDYTNWRRGRRSILRFGREGYIIREKIGRAARLC